MRRQNACNDFKIGKVYVIDDANTQKLICVFELWIEMIFECMILAVFRAMYLSSSKKGLKN